MRKCFVFVSGALDSWTHVTIKTPIPECRHYWCFCLEWCTNFVGSEYGLKHAECQTPAEYGLQHNSTPPPTATHCLYILNPNFQTFK